MRRACVLWAIAGVASGFVAPPAKLGRFKNISMMEVRMMLARLDLQITTRTYYF